MGFYWSSTLLLEPAMEKKQSSVKRGLTLARLKEISKKKKQCSAFSRIVGKLFSELKLVTDNLSLHLCRSQLRSHWKKMQVLQSVTECFIATQSGGSALLYTEGFLQPTTLVLTWLRCLQNVPTYLCSLLSLWTLVSLRSGVSCLSSQSSKSIITFVANQALYVWVCVRVWCHYCVIVFV